jgi:hypothetical protein
MSGPGNWPFTALSLRSYPSGAGVSWVLRPIHTSRDGSEAHHQQYIQYSYRSAPGDGATLTPVSTSIPALSPVSENLVFGPTGTSVITKLELRVKMDESYVAVTAEPEEVAVAELIQAQVSDQRRGWRNPVDLRIGEQSHEHPLEEEQGFRHGARLPGGRA